MKNPESIVLVESGEVREDAEKPNLHLPRPPAVVASVRRGKYGTGPFDENWLNVDCCGLFCAMFTYGLHVYGCYAVCTVLLPPWMSYIGENGIRSLSTAGHFHRVAFCTIAALAVISHFKAMTTDPGAVPPDAKPIPDPEDELESGSNAKKANNTSKNEEQNQDHEAQSLVTTLPPQKVRRLCRRCKAFKPQRAHHCSVCRRCIIKMDHHCPWVNNCVGIGNHKYFLLFIFYTLLSCVYSMILIITRFSSCMGMSHKRGDHSHHHEPHVSCLDQPTQLLTILGLLVEALLFGMFTFCMIFDQMDVISSKVTHIDRLKGLDLSSTLAGVTEVFGVGVRGVESRFRPDWLSPFTRVCFPPSVQDEVMGFCQPCLGSTSNQNKTEKETELPARTAARSMMEEIV
jgi:hypothetical protein